MSWITEIENIKKNIFGIVFISIILLITPGFTIIFYFFRELFINLDTLKLILLSISITTPLLIINFTLSTHLLETNKIHLSKGEQSAFISFIVSIVISAMFVYIALLFSYFLELDFYTTFLIGIGIQTLTVLLYIYAQMTIHFKK